MYVCNLSPQHNESYKAHTSTRATPTLAYFPPFLHIISLLRSDEDLLHRVHHLRPSLTLFSMHLHYIQINYSTMPLSLSLFFNSIQFNSTSYSHRTNVPYVLKLQKPEQTSGKGDDQMLYARISMLLFLVCMQRKTRQPLPMLMHARMYGSSTA